MSILSATGTVRIQGQGIEILAGAITSGHGSGPGGSGSLPFIPALNTLSVFGSNTLNSINPCPQGGCAYESGGNYANLLIAWSSAVYSKYYGALGAYALANGGDHDYFGNQLSVFPIVNSASGGAWETRFAGGAYPGVNAGFQGVPTQDLLHGEWAPNPGDGLCQPMIPHVNDSMFLLPPSLGGGPAGSLCLPNAAYCWLQNGSGWSHKCDLLTGIWTRASSNNASSTHEMTWCMDTLRGQGFGYECTSNDQNRVMILQFDASGVGVHSDKASAAFQVQYSVMEYVPSIDAAITFGKVNEGGWSLLAFDRGNNGAIHPLNTTGDILPACQGPGMAWVPDYGARGAFFINSTNSAEIQDMWRVEPPASNWQTNPWLVTRFTMIGLPWQGLTTNGNFKRLQYASAIGCLICVSATGAAINIYPVVGTAARSASLVQTLQPATLQSFGHNGTNTVALSTELVPWNASFSTLTNAKHLHVQPMPDGMAYLFPKDCAAVTSPPPTDGTVDGNQEIYKIDVPNRRISVEVPFYVPDSTQLQMANPDDAFWIPRGNELFYFWTVDAGLPGGIHIHPAPPGNYATQVDPSVNTCAWTPASLGGHSPYGTVRIAFGQPSGIHGDKGWRGVYCPAYDTFVIPVDTGGQTGFIVIRASDGANLTAFDGGLPWSFGTSNCKNTGIVLDAATGNAYMFDVFTASIMVVNVDQINKVSLGLLPLGSPGTYPVPVWQCAPFPFFSDQYVGKIVWHKRIRAAIMPVYDQWYVFQPDTGGKSIFQRADGLYNPVNGLWIGSSDTWYDDTTGLVGTIGSINFQGVPDNNSHFPGWYLQNFTLV